MVPADGLPLRRILASLSFPRSGSGFREAACCGWPGSLPARTRPPALAFALRLALLPLPPASAECQEVPVAGAPPARRPLSSPGSWVNPGYTCRQSPWVSEPLGCNRILACPSPPVGLPCGAQRSRSGCGPGTFRPRTPGPGQGGSLAPKVWACLFPRGLGGVCGGQALHQKGVVL